MRSSARHGNRETWERSVAASLRRCVAASLALGGALLAGCSHDDHRPAADPLAYGVTPPVPPISSAVVAPIPADGKAAPAPLDGKVPPIPVAGATMSNAALASGVPKPLPGGADLRIAAGATGALATSAPPVARAPETTAQPVSAVRGQAGSSMRITSYEQALAQLAARGVKWRRLETVGENGESQFSCSIPNPKNPFISRTYEAKAPGDLAAIQAVLDQIEKDGPGTGF